MKAHPVPEDVILVGAQGMLDLWGKPGRPDSVDRAEAKACLEAANDPLRREHLSEFRALLRSDRVQELFEQAVGRGWSFAEFIDDPAVSEALEGEGRS